MAVTVVWWCLGRVPGKREEQVADVFDRNAVTIKRFVDGIDQWCVIAELKEPR